MLIPTINNLSQDETKLLMILRTMHPYDKIEIQRDSIGELNLIYTQKEKWAFLTGRDDHDTMRGQ